MYKQMKLMKNLFGILITLAVLNSCDKFGNKDAQTISLAGTWNFSIDADKQGEKEKWFTSELPETVQLPGSMDENEKGTPVAITSARYLNRQYKYEGVAWYQKKVVIPEDWNKKHISLFIERAHWSSQVWVDDKKVPGVQESLSVPHRHDVTDFLTPGEHTLTVTIDNTVRFALGGHSYSQNTQTNWNGMTGRIELQAKDPVWIDDVQLYPNLVEKTLKVNLKLQNILENQSNGVLTFSVGKKLLEKEVALAANSSSEISVNVELPDDIELWDDFSPSLHTLEIELEGEGFKDQSATKFGMREVSKVKNRIAINGVPTFLRGNVENCEFPLTGYPSSSVEDWKEMFRVFQEYGLNHVRFHSYTPTKAAFIAADEMGMILQTELPFWGLTGEDAEKDAYLARELDRILDEYGNHPSFVMMCMGNELNVRAGDFNVTEKWVKHGQQKDPRHMYSASTSLFQKYRESDEYLIATRLRQISDAGTEWNHYKTLKDFYKGDPPAPVISHELGQWCVYPDFRDLPKYTGTLQPENLKIFKKGLEEHHMGDQATDFVLASGKLSALLYRQAMEGVFRTPGSGGFQLLQLHDFPGQGTATIGLLNVFKESKGVITPEAFRQSCDDAVALLRFEKRTWNSSDTFTGIAEFVHHRRTPMEGVTAEWNIRTDDGKSIASGHFDKVDVPNSELIELGNIAADLSAVKKASRLTVSLTVADEITNEWNIWVYPDIKEDAGDVLISKTWDAATKQALKDGKTVLFMPKLVAGPHTIPAQFLPPFWSPLFKTAQSSTMGLLMDPKHPVFKDFPTDFHTDWQWFDVLVTKKLPKSTAWMWSGFDTYAPVIENLPTDYRPIIQPIDHFYRNKRLGLLFEGTYGNGKIMICAADLDKDTDRRIAAPHLKQSILNYMNSEDFAPTLQLTDAMFEDWLDDSTDEALLKVKHVSSQHRKRVGANVLDGNGYSYWLTGNKKGINYPHEIHFEFPEPVLVKGFKYTPRQDFEKQGLIKNYEIYVTDHAFHWYTAVAKGTFKEGRKQQTVLFDKPKAGRNIRFVALEGMNKNDKYATMAEFELITEELTTEEYVP